MAKDKKNAMDECFDVFSTVNTKNYEENEWVLLIRGKSVFHDKSEEVVLNFAEKEYPSEVPCLVKVPSKQPLAV